MDSYYRLVSYQQHSLDLNLENRASARRGFLLALPGVVAMMTSVWAVLAMVLVTLRG
jgi:hypothetical protein